MNARLWVLHARARRVPAAAAGLVVLALASWVLGQHLAHAVDGVDPANRMVVTVIGSFVAAVLISSTLAGADDELELSTRSRWTALRCGPLIALTGVAAVLLALTGLWAPEQFGAHAFVRDVVGHVGLVALAAAVIGARASWVPALALALVALMGGPADPTTGWVVPTWQVQSTGVRAAGLTALVLGVAGLAVHARRGARAERF